MEKKLGKKISRRTFLKGAVAGTALLGPGIPYIAKKAVAAETLYIGVVSPASGNYADHGMMERMGMQMAADEFKEKGVLGRPVKLLVEDDETDPAVGARKARRLIEVDKVKFLLGGVSSSVAVSVGEVAQRAGVLYHRHKSKFRYDHRRKSSSLCLSCSPGHGDGLKNIGALYRRESWKEVVLLHPRL